jgi:hypothetical protein
MVARDERLGLGVVDGVAGVDAVGVMIVDAALEVIVLGEAVAVVVIGSSGTA